MLALLSPAKSLDETSPLPPALVRRTFTNPAFLPQTEELLAVLRQLSPPDIAALMGISDELAELNCRRYADIDPPFTRRNARPAMVLFAGDVYRGLQAGQRFNGYDWSAANKSVRILSGLYGLLRPLDLIAPYRLEMGTSLHTPRGKNLYQFWGDSLRDAVADALQASAGADVVVNLASHEYATAAKLPELDVPVVSPRFEDQAPSGGWKVLSLFAKQARGEFAAWLVTERVRTAKALTGFNGAGYAYVAAESTPAVPVFRRER